MKLGLLRILSLFLLSLLASLQAAGQSGSLTEMTGARFESAANRVADTNASFALGLTLDDGSSFRTSALLSDSVRIMGRIRPDPAHVGQTADIFLVDRVNLVFMMKNQDGNFVPWDARVPTLVPFLEAQTLSADMEVEVFSGTLGEAGDHRIFIGYLPAGGSLHYTPEPHRLEITEESPSERAFAMFSSTISPDIVETLCIQCHVSGGSAHAGGAYHIFRSPPGDYLESNFSIFQGLVKNRSVSYILSKVTGGSSHGGGVQLTSGSQEYQALAEFLELVAQDLPEQVPPHQWGAGEPASEDGPYPSP